MKRHLWHLHPGVRTGDDLSFGERAADRLKAAFGSWPFLIVLNLFIVAWTVLNWVGVVHFDLYPFIALNLLLSWLAAQQGGALQIAANRGDRIASELAQHDFAVNQQALARIEENTRITEATAARIEQILTHLGIDDPDQADDTAARR